MKRVLLICPDPSPALTAVTGGLPLALATFLGKPLIEHALDGLARNGASHVRILASDRPSDIRAYLIKHPDLLAQNLAHRLLIYALGRPLGFTDQPTVRRLQADWKAKGYTPRQPVHPITTSELKPPP